MVWNVDKVLNQEAPHFDPRQVGVTAIAHADAAQRAAKVDDLTVELVTSEPDSLLPINLTNLFMASPAHWEKLRAGERATRRSAPSRPGTPSPRNPSGTGPWKWTRFVPRERARAGARTTPTGTPSASKVDRLVLLPMPEANARTAALLSGQVDWIETPRRTRCRSSSSADSWSSPERAAACLAVAVLPRRGLALERRPGAPGAPTSCIDRDAMKDGLLSGLMVPATGTFEPGHPWRGNPTFQISIDRPRRAS